MNQHVKIASENSAKVWQQYPKKKAIYPGSDDDVTIVDMDKEATIDANNCTAKIHPAPWNGWKVKELPVCTIVRGHVQMRDGEPAGKPIGRMQKPILDQ